MRSRHLLLFTIQCLFRMKKKLHDLFIHSRDFRKVLIQGYTLVMKNDLVDFRHIKKNIFNVKLFKKVTHEKKSFHSENSNDKIYNMLYSKLKEIKKKDGCCCMLIAFQV